MFVPQQWKVYAFGITAGIVGFILAFSVWHLWQDHAALHQIIGFLNAQAAQAAQHGATK